MSVPDRVTYVVLARREGRIATERFSDGGVAKTAYDMKVNSNRYDWVGMGRETTSTASLYSWQPPPDPLKSTAGDIAP